MFDSGMDFYGKHAEYLQMLVSDRGNAKAIFSSMIETVVAAAPIGFICGRRGKETKEIELMGEGKTDYKKSIFYDQVKRYRDSLEKNYRMIMLLEDKEHLSIDTRLNRAFKYDDDASKRKEGDLIFREYILGGLEILYEDLIKDSKKAEDDFMNCAEFIKDCSVYGGGKFSSDNVIRLCDDIDELLKQK